MKKRRLLLRWAGILLVGTAFFGAGMEAQGGEAPAPAAGQGRPDQIKIDTLAAFGKLELPPVTFFHDKHTEALVKEQKGCDACHFVKDKKLSLAYRHTQGKDPEEIQNIYHASCIGCHNEMVAAGKKSGPQDGFCRSCHNAEPPGVERLDAGLDKVLHYRHVSAKAITPNAPEKDNCGRCHHELDQKTKKTVYVKGKEDSCRACHAEKPGAEGLSQEQAAHQQCVLCHLDMAQKGGKDVGPYTCGGCHGAEGQALTAKNNQEVVQKVKEIPRLQRGQPDAVLISYDAPAGEAKGVKPYVMNPVPFDHKAHEKYSESCRVCHHAGISSCDQCHTMAGSAKGGKVTFGQAMHRVSSNQSCVGCHTAQQAAPQCAGCHNQIDRAGGPDQDTCKQCHVTPPKSLAAGSPMTPQMRAGLAEGMVKGRQMSAGTYDLNSVPEKVVIKELSDKYEPVEFAHRKVVQSLLNGVKDNRLAQYFHSDPGTFCQGCHHNSPASQTPPRCGNCHAKQFDAKEPKRPGLMAAFHGQCMGCHKDMDVKPVATACTECHLEKKKLALGLK